MTSQTPSGDAEGEVAAPLGSTWQLPLCEAASDHLRCDKLAGHLGKHHDLAYAEKWTDADA